MGEWVEGDVEGRMGVGGNEGLFEVEEVSEFRISSGARTARM